MLTVWRSAVSRARVKNVWVILQKNYPLGRSKVKACTVPGVSMLSRRAVSRGVILAGLRQPLSADNRVPMSLTVEFSGKRARFKDVETRCDRRN